MPEWLDMFTGWGGVAVVGAAVLLGGFLRGFIGFGGAMVTVPVFTLVLGPLVAVPLSVLVGLPATVQLLPTAVRHAERALVLPMVGGLFLAAPLGTLALVTVPAEFMKIAIALIVLLMVGLLARGWRPVRPLGLRACFAAGAVAGLVQGSAGVGGPPVVAAALSRPGPPERQRANVLGAMTAMPVCSVPPMLWHGMFTTEVVVASLVVIPVNMVAIWLGARFFTERGRNLFRNAALAALAVIGALTLGFAIRDAFAG